MKVLLIIASLFLAFACGFTDSTPPIYAANQEALPDSGKTVCIIGDPGTGDANAVAVARALETVECSQIRVLGDIVYPSGIKTPGDPVLNQRFLSPYRYFIDRKVPLYLVLGNHDHKQDGAAWLAVAKQNPPIHFPNYYYSENWGTVCIFSLDTSFYDKVYFVHERYPQTQWLQKALADQAKTCEFSVALGHHPYRSSGSHGDARWHLAWFFDEELVGKVDLYLAGHDHHLSDEGIVKGTHFLISGSAGLLYPLKTPSEDKRFAVSKHGFLTLHFARDRKNKIVASYTFYSLVPDGKGGYSGLTAEWNGQITGQGIRIE